MIDSSLIQAVLLQGWNLGDIHELKVLKEDRVWRLSSRTYKKYVLKNWGRMDPDVEQRARFYQGVMRHVQGCGIGAECAIPTVNGKLFHWCESEAWWITELLPSDANKLTSDEDEELQRNYGREIGPVFRNSYF